jgi:hypothetical protein
MGMEPVPDLGESAIARSAKISTAMRSMLWRQVLQPQAGGEWRQRHFPATFSTTSESPFGAKCN